MQTTAGASKLAQNQYKKPSGWVGRWVLWRMNERHSKLTDWGLTHVSVRKQDTILDVGCGGGATIRKLAAMATEGKVYGVDYSEASAAAAKRNNAQGIASGRVEIQQCSVSQLPFADNLFDLVTAVETHFWWPNLPGDMSEIFRVVKPGGTFIVIAEVYKGAQTMVSKLAEQYAPRVGMTILSVEEHRALFVDAGFADVEVSEERQKGWICAAGRKPRAKGGPENEIA